MLCSFVNLISCANKDDYVFGFRTDFNTPNPCMFNNHWWIWPGQKLYFNTPTGGVASAIKYTAASQSDAEAFFRKVLAPASTTRFGRGISNRTSSGRSTESPTSETLKSVLARLKFPKFRIQTNTLTTYEQYMSSSFGRSRTRQYKGRYFGISSAFISCKKQGNTYNIVYAPYTVSLISKTFLWDRGHWNYVTEESTFDKSRATDKRYIDVVYNYVKQGKKMIDAPYQVLIANENIEKIYQRLAPFIANERQKFIKMT